MKVLSLCQQYCPEKIPLNVCIAPIGDGREGEVFEFKNKDSKLEQVIKFSLSCENEKFILEDKFQYISKVLNYLIKNPHNAYARVYEHVYMGTYTRPFINAPNEQQKCILHYYVMEKLNKITEDESKVFHTILSHEDRNLKKCYQGKKLREILLKLKVGLDFDIERVILFCELLNASPVIQLDLHERNIMKDNQGNFKLVDLDRLQLRNDYEV